MKTYPGITAAIVLVLLAQAQADVQGSSKEAIKVPITTIQGHRKPSTVGRWVHALRKYRLSTGPILGAGGPKGVQRGRVASDPTNVAHIPLVDYDFDREYFGTVMVGEPPQSFKIDFDTGSSQFILSSKGCTECSGDSHYDATASRTFRTFDEPLSATYDNGGIESNNSTSSTFINPSGARLTSNPKNAWHITYGDMSHAEGYLGRDLVTLDGTLKVQNQALALVTSESTGFDDTIDGIMGLAFGALSTNTQRVRTVFESMMDQGLVDQGVFSFYLGKSKYGGGGEVIFGGVDMERVENGKELVYTPVTKAKYWQINIESLYVTTGNKGEKVKLGNNNKGKDGNSKGGGGASDVIGIMDTGTTLVIVPYQIANAIHGLVPGAQPYGPSWAVPCSLGETHPEGRVDLQIEGQRFGIPFEDLVRESVKSEGAGDGGSDNANVTEQGEQDEESLKKRAVKNKNKSKSKNKNKNQSKNKNKHKNKSKKSKKQKKKAHPKQSDLVNEDDDEEGDEIDAQSIDGKELCFSGIQPSSAKFMIIGDVFIKNNLVVFDQENKRVGIAPLRFDERVRVAEDESTSQDAREKEDGENESDASDEGGESEEETERSRKAEEKAVGVIENMYDLNAKKKDRSSSQHPYHRIGHQQLQLERQPTKKDWEVAQGLKKLEKETRP